MSKFAVNTNNKFLKLPNYVLGVYNAWDAHNTARLVKPLIDQLKRNQQWEFYVSHVEPLQEAVVAMSRRGILLDKDARIKYRKSLRDELYECDSYLVAANGNPKFDPNSDMQVAKWLFSARPDGLGLKVAKLTDKSKKPSVDQESLTRVLRGLRKMDAHALPVLHALFHRSRIATILDRYMKIEAGFDGRVRPRVKMAKAKTTRFAYADPALQQFPPEARIMFVAKPGHVFLSVDYSQLEAQLLARFANDIKSVEVFDSGGDVHRDNASDLFIKPPPSISDAERNYSKSFLYRISYGGEGSEKEKTFCPCERWGCGAKLPDTLKLTRAQKLEAETRWFAKHHAVRVYQRDLCDQVKRFHFYDHPLGGRRYFTSTWGAELERELKNEPMQRGGAILMARAQIALHYEYDAPIILQMHDEFILEVPEHELPMWVKRVQEIMERPVGELGGAIIRTDAEWGYNWGKKTEDNPRGIRKYEAAA